MVKMPDFSETPEKAKHLYTSVTLLLHMEQNSYNIKIVRALLKSSNHIRGLARAINTSQMTVVRKVEELYKDNVVDFRQEGKNKVVFLKKSLEAKQYAYAVEMQNLLEVLKKYPYLRRIIELVRKNKKISLAMLFGSYAKGNAGKESDIDIYLDTSDSKVKGEIEMIDSRISAKIGKYDSGSILIKEIEKNHVVLKGIEEFYEKNKFFD
jgi:predicted nucleotidyltransferase